MRPRYIALIIAVILSASPLVVRAVLDSVRAGYMEDRVAAQLVPEHIVTQYMQSEEYRIGKAEKMLQHLDLPIWAKKYQLAQLLVLSGKDACFRDYDTKHYIPTVTCVKDGKITHPPHFKWRVMLDKFWPLMGLVWMSTVLLAVYCFFPRRMFKFLLIASFPAWLPVVLSVCVPSHREIVVQLSDKRIEEYRAGKLPASQVKPFGDLWYSYPTAQKLILEEGYKGCIYRTDYFKSGVSFSCVKDGKWVRYETLSGVLEFMVVYSFIFTLLLPAILGIAAVLAVILTLHRRFIVKNPSNS